LSSSSVPETFFLVESILFSSCATNLMDIDSSSSLRYSWVKGRQISFTPHNQTRETGELTKKSSVIQIFACHVWACLLVIFAGFPEELAREQAIQV
jgi:hypothetical protein